MKNNQSQNTSDPFNACVTSSGLSLLTYALLAVNISLTLLLYLPVFKYWRLLYTAKESYYSHGLLIPFLFVFIIWLNRKRLGRLAVVPSPMGYFVVIPCLCAAVLLIWAPAPSLAGLLLPLLLWGAILLVMGKSIARALTFPIAYLYFMCPLPTEVLTALSFRIRVLSTMGASLMLRLCSLHATRTGTMIELPNGIVMSVESPCSGFRFLISLFALAVLYAYLTQGPRWGKYLLVLTMIPLSVVLNSVRLFLVGVVGSNWGMSAMVSFHDNWAGLIMMVLGFVSLYLLSRLFKCAGFNSTLSS